MALGIAAGIHLVYRVIGYFSATAAQLEPREWVRGIETPPKNPLFHHFSSFFIIFSVFFQ